MTPAERMLLLELDCNHEGTKLSAIVTAWKSDTGDSAKAIVRTIQRANETASIIYKKHDVVYYFDDSIKEHDGNLSVFNIAPSREFESPNPFGRGSVVLPNNKHYISPPYNTITKNLHRNRDVDDNEKMDIVRSVIKKRDKFLISINPRHQENTTNYDHVVYGDPQVPEDEMVCNHVHEMTGKQYYGFPYISTLDYFLFTPNEKQFLSIYLEDLAYVLKKTGGSSPPSFEGQENYYINFDKTTKLIGIAQKCYIDLCVNSDALDRWNVSDREEAIKIWLQVRYPEYDKKVKIGKKTIKEYETIATWLEPLATYKEWRGRKGPVPKKYKK